METAVFLVLGFLTGSIPFSWLLGRLKGVDLRDHGSGNPGATNLLRTCGKGMGVAGLLLDAFKGAAPVYAVLQWGPESTWMPAGVALCAVAGHVFMPWFGFKGGKGVATTLGALLILAPMPVLCSLGVFLVLVAVFRMISLGSVAGGIAIPLWSMVFPQPFYTNIVLVLIAVAIVITHRANIKRIITGTERKLGQK